MVAMIAKVLKRNCEFRVALVDQCTGGGDNVKTWIQGSFPAAITLIQAYTYID
jgi:hypothetical protein